MTGDMKITETELSKDQNALADKIAELRDAIRKLELKLEPFMRPKTENKPEDAEIPPPPPISGLRQWIRGHVKDVGKALEHVKDLTDRIDD